jgi:TonB family protein
MRFTRYVLVASLLLPAGRAAAQESALPPVAPPPPLSEGTYDISAVEVPPRITNRAAATRAAEELFGKAVGPEGGRGSVTLRFFIDTDGTTSRAMVVVPTGNPALDEAALAALRAMRFTPAQINRRGVRVFVQLPLSYDVPPRKAEGAERPNALPTP